MNYNQQQGRGFQSAGKLSLDPYTQQLLQQNQMQFEMTLAQRQKQQQYQQQYYNQMMENQNRILMSLVQQHSTQKPEYYMPPPAPQLNKKFQNSKVNLKSIMLKPLQYYSQQMNNVQFQQPYQPQIYQQQQLQQQQQQQIQMERPYGFKERKPVQQSVEIQTDDEITQFEKFQRMGLANSVVDKVQDDGWAPDNDDDQKAMQDNPDYEKGKNWNFQQQQRKQDQFQDQQQQQVLKQKFKPLPPGMNKQQRAKQNLKTFRLAFAYLLFYWIEIDKSNKIRRQQALEEKGQKGIKCLQSFLEYFKKTLPKVIQSFADNKADMFITDKKKILEEEMSRRISNVKLQVRKFIIALVESFNPKLISEEQIDFLGSVLHDFEYLPQNFMFLFELNRFEYTTFGALKNMTSTRAHMLILTFIVIRVYLFRLILKPWVQITQIIQNISQTDFPEIKKKEQLSKNCYVVGSVIYEIVMDFIKDRCHKIGQNQAHLDMDRKINPRPYGPLTTDRYQLPEDPAEVRVIRQQEEPIIMGLEKREDLKAILEEDKRFIQEMQDYLEEFADSIYDIVHIRYVLKKAEYRKVIQNYNFILFFKARFEKKLKYIEQTFKEHPQEVYEAQQLAKKINAESESKIKI